MDNPRLCTGDNGGSRAGDEAMLKLTALVRLKQALDSERFEECGELIRTAKKQGAEPQDIRLVIDQSLNGAGRVQRPQKPEKTRHGLRRF